MELSTVIVNYRSSEPLLECLAALDADAAGIAHEIVVVDNDPSDGGLVRLGTVAGYYRKEFSSGDSFKADAFMGRSFRSRSFCTQVHH